jgi:hypothetical protein
MKHSTNFSLYGCENFREEHTFQVFENDVHTKLFGMRRTEVNGQFKISF